VALGVAGSSGKSPKMRNFTGSKVRLAEEDDDVAFVTNGEPEEFDVSVPDWTGEPVLPANWISVAPERITITTAITTNVDRFLAKSVMGQLLSVLRADTLTKGISGLESPLLNDRGHDRQAEPIGVRECERLKVSPDFSSNSSKRVPSSCTT